MAPLAARVALVWLHDVRRLCTRRDADSDMIAALDSLLTYLGLCHLLSLDRIWHGRLFALLHFLQNDA